MHDLRNLPELAPPAAEGSGPGEASCEGRLRLLRKWPVAQIYERAAPLRPPQASPCGGDCKACGMAEGDGLGVEGMKVYQPINQGE